MWLAGGKYAPTFPHQLRWLPNHAAVASQTRPPNPKVNRVVANITLHSTKPRTQAGPPPPCYIVNHPTLEGTEGKKKHRKCGKDTHYRHCKARPDPTRRRNGLGPRCASGCTSSCTTALHELQQCSQATVSLTAHIYSSGGDDDEIDRTGETPPSSMVPPPFRHVGFPWTHLL